MSDLGDLQPEDEKPLDPEVEKVRRRMVRLLVVSIGIMMIGLMAVLGAIVYKIGQGGKNKPDKVAVSDLQEFKTPDGVIEQDITLPQGSKLLSSSLAGNRMLLSLELADGNKQLLIYDIPSSKIIARFDLVN